MITKLGKNNDKKNKYNYCAIYDNLQKKKGNSTNKSRKKSPKLRVRHATNKGCHPERKVQFF